MLELVVAILMNSKSRTLAEILNNNDIMDTT
jgi:hypothetical protein